ncbi:MAG: DUF4350 domain-containing protein [Oryzomonas sp.]|uniref:DUF4350 domain-containing protein n=1 Tax=Oryzomonas sp. TaxID=2855186 RepID=UPI00283F87C3|nr:DUF4350 domain-containing protein [Oryzomonas sp.]MDR3580668.1 DUF4350 domain-containing protein [Oryzomonas sp.]
MRSIISSICFVALLQLSVALSHAGENSPVIVFDEGHGQRFAIDNKGDLQLSKLAETMRASGAHVTKTKDVLSDDSLKGVSALVISGLFKPLQPGEVEAIVRFIQKGGRLAVMMHIAPPLSNLIYRFKLGFSIAVIHERQNIIDQDINFRLTDLTPHPLFKGIDNFSAYGVWAIDPCDAATAIARTSPTAWLDLNGDGILSKGDLVQALAVVVTGSLGSGNYVIFGDDAIFQNRFLEGNNQKLAVNLTTWLIAK